MGRHTFTQKFLPLALAAAMAVPAVPVMAATNDISGHWAEKVMAEWQEKGLMKGYSDGSLKPNNSITRAEFITLLNNAKGLTAESSISFTDVKPSDWFFGAVARAAGYTKGYEDGTFRPNQTITRAEAAIMLANAAGLTANESGANGFTDAIPAWAKGSIGAVAAAGFMSGYPDGSFGASANITRAEAVSSLDRMLNGAQETEPNKGEDVVIEKAGTVLENETVTGNLTIAASVGEGDVTLKNVEIKGDLIVKGGGSNSIRLEDVKVGGKLTLDKDDVHLILAGNTNIPNAEMKSPARITTETFDININTLLISLDKPSDKDILINAAIGKLELETKANLILGANVNQLIVGKNAENSKIQIKSGSTVAQLTANAKVTLTGAGKINQLNAAASGVMLDSSLSMKKTVTAAGVKAPTIISSGGSGGGGTTPAPKIEIKSVKAIDGIEVATGTTEEQVKKSLPSMVALLDKDGKEIKAEIGDWKIKDGSFDGTKAGSYTFIGTVKIPDGYSYSNGTLTAEATIKVKAAGQATTTKSIYNTDFSFDIYLDEYVSDANEIKAAAMAATDDQPTGKNETFPKTATLLCEDGSAVEVDLPELGKWTLDPISGSSTGDYDYCRKFSYTFGANDLPAGYGYPPNMAVPLEINVYIKDLDKTALAASYEEYQQAKALLAKLESIDNVAKATDANKTYIVSSNGTAETIKTQITKGVGFVPTSDTVTNAYKALEDACTNAKKGFVSERKHTFSSQKQYEDVMDALSVAVKEVNDEIIAKATNGTLENDAYVVGVVKEWLKNQYNAPWSDEVVLTPDSKIKYSLPESNTFTIEDEDETSTSIYVALSWSYNNTYLTKDPNGNGYLVLTDTAPTEPTDIVFTAKLTEYRIDNDSPKSDLNLTVSDYNVKVGAPVSVKTTEIDLYSGDQSNVNPDVSKPGTTPDETANVLITLTAPLAEAPSTLSGIKVKEEASSNPLFTDGITVSNSKININNSQQLILTLNTKTAQLPAVLTSTPSAEGTTHKTTKLKLSIPKNSITLSDAATIAGWYVPDMLEKELTAYVHNPAVDTKTIDVQTSGNNVTVKFNVQYLIRDKKIQVALAPENVDLNNNGTLAKSEIITPIQSQTEGYRTCEATFDVSKLAPDTYKVWIKVDGTDTWLNLDKTVTVGATSNAGGVTGNNENNQESE